MINLIGILVVTHGTLSKSLLETARMFVNDSEAIEFVCFTEGQGVEDLRDSVREKLKEMAACQSILCFADIPGGSPARVLTEMLIENSKLELITGVNLPMIVEAILSRKTMDKKSLVEYLVDSSRSSINDIGQIVRNH